MVGVGREWPPGANLALHIMFDRRSVLDSHLDTGALALHMPDPCDGYSSYNLSTFAHGTAIIMHLPPLDPGRIIQAICHLLTQLCYMVLPCCPTHFVQVLLSQVSGGTLEAPLARLQAPQGSTEQQEAQASTEALRHNEAVWGQGSCQCAACVFMFSLPSRPCVRCTT